jgi:hypothetical protein
MKTFPFNVITFLLLCPLLLTACANLVPTHSGFLVDYTDLRPQEKNDNLEATASLGSIEWNEVHIEPVRFVNNDQSQASHAEGQNALCGVLEQALAEEFADLSLTGSDHSRAVRIKAAITGVNRSQPLLNFFTALALFVPVDNGGVSVEIEATEEGSGRRIVAMSGARNGSLFALSGYFKSYGHAEAGLKELAHEFRLLLLAPTSASTRVAQR